MLSTLSVLSQLFFSAVASLYFLQLFRSRRESDHGLEKESRREMGRLHAMRRIQLTEPLSEKTRPSSFAEIRGQENGKRALLAALCGENPQHIILYGPPGVGKTAAGRAALSEAIKNPLSPFGETAKFVEMDATTLQYDERGIADPLIGSVHDPIYQGAGAYGPGGIPQPKAGAVTKAHGGILFLDEIGELPPLELNRLLKVLEDRRVFFESAYYSRDNADIPRHIHDIFQNGLPADFRLVGATTRRPEEMPPALRSRCTEIFFDALSTPEILAIAAHAAKKGGFCTEENVIEAVADYAQNGRDAVNLIQTAGSFAHSEGRSSITRADILWVAEAGRYAPRLRVFCSGKARVGAVRGLAVAGADGFVMDIEAVVTREKGGGFLRVTGAAETETISVGPRQLSRKASALAAVENMLAFLETISPFRRRDYQVHIHFPSATVADGPSAGLAILAALYSALYSLPIPDYLAFTGEVTPRGAILPVGGIAEKAAAAESAGIQTVFMPAENAAGFRGAKIEMVGFSDASAFLSRLFGKENAPAAPPAACNFSALT